MQPSWAKDGGLVKLVRLILNRELGGYRGGSDGANSIRGTMLDDMTVEFRSRILPGDLVLHRKRFIDGPRVACVASLTESGGARTADLLVLSLTAAGSRQNA